MNTIAVRLAQARVDEAAWPVPLHLEGYDRRVALAQQELHTLLELGPLHLRRSRARDAQQRTTSWELLARLVTPLGDARTLLHHRDEVRYRRASTHAAGLVLQHCADTGHSYWGWTATDWATLACPTTRQFIAARSVPTETTMRPFLIAIGYLLGGVTDLDQFGTFNRKHLGELVFGPDAVELALRQAGEILNQWGYRGVLTDCSRWRGMLSQALLLNRSPRLDDLSTDAFARLRAHPANREHHGQMLYALQRAVAALGHCQPPVRRTSNTMAAIEGAHPTWSEWVEKWHATSPLTRKVRDIIRTIMAKAGRWLAVEHPDIIEPSQWTRQTCASWVAAVDRMAVGDYVQRRDALGERSGKPIAAPRRTS